MRYQTGLITILFTDLVGSTALKEQVGDRTGAGLIQQHHSLVRELLRGFPGGQEIETAGDSFLIVFTKPSDAVHFGLLLHARLRALNQGLAARLEDRIGIHVGEVVIREQDGSPNPKGLTGIQVDTCARVMGLAQGGQILLTRSAFDNARQMLKGEEVAGVGPLEWLNHGSYLLKGIETALEVCEVGEAGMAPLQAPAGSEKAQRQVTPESEPVLGWRPALGQFVPDTRWRLETKLGEGGFGEVWLGRNPTTKERRVFKFCFQVERVRFLKRELTLFRLLKERVGEHPNLVRLHDVYLDQPPFYVEMDHVEGADLRSWCEGHGGVEAVPLATRLEIVAQAADGLQAAHDAGIIHRDIKPANILIGNPKSEIRNPKVEVKLTDFGIGQVVSEEYLAGITRAGFTQTILSDSSSSPTGTQLYMAPELLAGKPASTRSDIYSLGVVLYQLVLGDFTRPVTTDWANEISDPLLREDLKHCFAGNPQDRFAGAGQLAEHLRALPERRAALERQQAELAAREKAAYRRGVVRATAVAGVVILTIAALALVAVRLAGTTKRALLESQRLLYAAEMNLAQQAWEDGSVGRALELLNDHRPKAGQEDLRGFEWRLLWQLAQGDAVATLRGHTAFVQCVAVSPDGQMLASGSGDCTIKLWDVAARRELATFEKPSALLHSADIRSLEFSPDGKTLASGASNGKVKLWDVAAQREIAVFTNSAGWVERVAFSRDGRLVAGALKDGSVKIWDVAARRERVALQGPPVVRPSVAFSMDGKTLAASSGDHEVKLWDFVTKRELATFTGHDGIVVFVAFSPDGNILASSSSDSTITLWDVHSRREIVTLHGHKAWVSSATFSPDGKTLVSTCVDGTMKLWDVALRRELATLRGHHEWINHAVFFPDGKMLASASDDQTLKLWNVTPKPSGNVLGGYTNAVNDFTISPDGKSLVTVGESGTIREWEMASQREVASFVGHTDAVRCVAFSPDGRALASAGNDHSIKLWDVGTQRQSATLEGHLHAVFAVGFSPDGKLLASGGDDETIRLWDVAARRQIATLRGDTNGTYGLVFSPDGRILASLAGEVGTWVMLWDLATKTKLAALHGRTTPIFSLVFFPDGRTLATGEHKIITLWDLTTKRPRKTLSGHSGWVAGLALSPDGKTLASAGNEGNLKLWNLTALREVATVPGRIPPGTGKVEFTSNGNTLVALGSDRLVRVWHAPTFAEIQAAEAIQAKRD